MTHQVKMNKDRCIENAKTLNSGKIAGEEKCMNEREDVKERQMLALIVRLFSAIN